MPNQHTKNRVTEPDQNHAHVLVGPSNEEMVARQEQAERERAEKGYPKVEFSADAHDKSVDGFGDMDYDPLGITDPLAAIKREHGRPGFALKLLSPDVINKLGRRGYQIVKDRETGAPVQCGRMLLGEIPQQYADRRKRAVAERANDELKTIQDQQREAIEKLKHDAKGLGVEVIEPGERINVGDNGPNVYDASFSVTRGEDTSGSR